MATILKYLPGLAGAAISAALLLAPSAFAETGWFNGLRTAYGRVFWMAVFGLGLAIHAICHLIGMWGRTGREKVAVGDWIRVLCFSAWVALCGGVALLVTLKSSVVPWQACLWSAAAMICMAGLIGSATPVFDFISKGVSESVSLIGRRCNEVEQFLRTQVGGVRAGFQASSRAVIAAVKSNWSDPTVFGKCLTIAALTGLSFDRFRPVGVLALIGLALVYCHHQTRSDKGAVENPDRINFEWGVFGGGFSGFTLSTINRYWLVALVLLGAWLFLAFEMIRPTQSQSAEQNQSSGRDQPASASIQQPGSSVTNHQEPPHGT